MELYEELNKKLKNMNFDKFNTNFAVLNHPNYNRDTYIYVAKYNNGSYKVFDGGSTITTCSLTYNLSSKEFINKFVEIIEKNQVSKQDKILYIDCFENNLEKSILNLYNTQIEILSI